MEICLGKSLGICRLLRQIPKADKFSCENHMYISRCIFPVNHITWMYLCLLLLYMKPFCVTSYLPVKSVNVLCVFLSVSICVHILVWSFTLTEKSDCDIIFTLKIELVLSVASIITIKVKLPKWSGIALLYGGVSLYVSFSVSLKDIHYTSLQIHCTSF